MAVLLIRTTTAPVIAAVNDSRTRVHWEILAREVETAKAQKTLSSSSYAGDRAPVLSKQKLRDKTRGAWTGSEKGKTMKTKAKLLYVITTVQAAAAILVLVSLPFGDLLWWSVFLFAACWGIDRAHSIYATIKAIRTVDEWSKKGVEFFEALKSLSLSAQNAERSSASTTETLN